MSWYEVESKIKILDYKKIKKEVAKIATFKEKQTKNDDYFALHIKGYPKKSFRIRKVKNQYVVNFKKKSDNLSDKEVVVKEEFELVLNHKSDVKFFLELQTS